MNADPDNTIELLKELDALVRQHDGRVGRARGWLHEYDLIVVAPGRLGFTVAGEGSLID